MDLITLDHTYIRLTDAQNVIKKPLNTIIVCLKFTLIRLDGSYLSRVTVENE